MDPVCPACGAALGPVVHHGVRDFEHGMDARADFRPCPACGLLLQVPVPSPEALRGFYPSDYRPHATASGGVMQGGLFARLKDIQAGMLLSRLRPYLPGPDGRILELGCGSGHLLRLLRRRGYQHLSGIDRNPALAATFAGSGIAFHARDLETSALTVEGSPFDSAQRSGAPSFDTILMSYVLEHFSDPAAVLARCRELLTPTGRVLLLTPSAASLCHRVFGSYWSGLHAPRHTQIFTPKSLRMVAQRLGYREVSIDTLVDPAGWSLSFQNWVQAQRAGAPPRAGTAWYSLALLPLWMPAAQIERLMGQGQAMVASLQR